MSQNSDSEMQHTDRPAIETAAATTSSEKNSSGPFAYILAAITIAGLFAIGSGMSGCVSLAAGIVADEMGNTPYSLQNYYDDIDHYFENDESSPIGDEDILNLLDNGTPEQDQGQGQVNDSLGTSLTPTEALSADLAVYGSTIDSLVSAFDYAGAQEGVTDFARTVERMDGDATTELIGTLRAILREDVSVADGLSQAAEAADKVADEFGALEIPEASGSKSSDIAKGLEEARAKAAERWTAIAAEMRLIAASDSISRTDLDEADKTVSDATTAAAESLSKALTTSAEA